MRFTVPFGFSTTTYTRIGDAGPPQRYRQPEASRRRARVMSGSCEPEAPFGLPLADRCALFGVAADVRWTDDGAGAAEVDEGRSGGKEGAIAIVVLMMAEGTPGGN